MFVSPHVHALWPEFEIELPGGKKLSRFVTSYVIEGEKLAVVDTAVASAAEDIFGFIENTGMNPEDVDLVINTHCHFDHIGGNGVFQELADPSFCAHPMAIPYIEDLERQMRVRPVGKMIDLCSGPVLVHQEINEGDVIDLGDGVEVHVFHTPGHSAGSVSLHIPKDGVLICGDVLPEPGTLPVYEDVGQTLASLEKLRSVNADCLLSAMSLKVSRGDRVRAHIDAGEEYIRDIDRLVRLAEQALTPSPNPVEDIARQVFSELNLPEEGLIPIVLRTFEAHRQVIDLGRTAPPSHRPGPYSSLA